MRTRSATARTSSTAKAPGPHNQDIKLVTNPDYEARASPERRPDDHVLHRLRTRPTPTLQSGNLDVLDHVPDAAFATYQTDFPDRTSTSPPRSSSRSPSRSTSTHFDGTTRRASCVARPSRSRSTATRSPTSSSRHPHPGQGLHVPGHRRLLGRPRGLRRPDVRRRQGQGAVGRGRRHLALRRHAFTIAYNADGGHQDWVDAVDEQHLEHARHQGRGQVRTRPSPSSRPTRTTTP